MRVAIIGCGPAGLFLGTALARRGHHVTALDRDPGPAPDGQWPRRGVMQFHHAQWVRPQVHDVLRAELPDALAGWLAAGAEPIHARPRPAEPAGPAGPDGPDGPPDTGLLGVRSRRETFERALRTVADRQPGLELRRGHVDGVCVRGDRVTGVRVGDAVLRADLVIDASGRAGRATRDLRPTPDVDADSGLAYTDRQYVLRPGAAPGPLTNPLIWQADLDGYRAIVFPHERRIFSVLLLRATADPGLRRLRHTPAFEAACRAVPALAEWTDPARARPISPVYSGAGLVNRYVGQPGLRGLVLAGDVACTTTPMFGRGLATALRQAAELLRRIDDDGGPDPAGFGAWCDAHLRPWAVDHDRMDRAALRRWNGADVDPSGPLPSDLVLQAAAVDPVIGRTIGPYLAMDAGPESLDPVRERARAVYRSGWRPAPVEGPDRDELAALAHAALTG